jgi:type VI secretion system secreted protein VgrG
MSTVNTVGNQDTVSYTDTATTAPEIARSGNLAMISQYVQDNPEQKEAVLDQLVRSDISLVHHVANAGVDTPPSSIADKPSPTQMPTGGAIGPSNTTVTAQNPPAPATASTLAPARTPADAPNVVNLSALNGTFSSLWDKSLPNGEPLEHGGTLVSDEKGNLQLVNTGEGFSGMFRPNLKVEAGQTVQGMFHTHPYSQAEGGHTGSSFSGGDVRYMLENKHNMIMAQSGSDQFMLLRTQATPTTLGARRIEADHGNRINQHLRNGMSFSDATRQASRETAKAYGLAYYEGTGGVLTRVTP